MEEKTGNKGLAMRIKTPRQRKITERKKKKDWRGEREREKERERERERE